MIKNIKKDLDNNLLIEDYFNKEIETIKQLDYDEIEKVIELLDNALINNQKIYIFGNGGSASTASHFTCDFNKIAFERTNNRFNVTCLSDNIALLTAISNDIKYEEVYRYQLMSCLKKDDIVIAISGSGNSKNIINAVNYAKEVGATVVGFTGYDGGRLKEISDISLNTNINNMQISEDIHLMFEHLIISAIGELYGRKEY